MLYKIIGCTNFITNTTLMIHEYHVFEHVPQEAQFDFYIKGSLRSTCLCNLI